jgi:hypothetical protein
MNNRDTEKLIRAIREMGHRCGELRDETKLLKLLYLFDVEYHRAHRQTFTGFGWKFFHLGPCAAEFDSALDALVDTGMLLLQQRSNADIDTSFYRSAEEIDPRAPFDNAKDEYILRDVLKTGGTGALVKYSIICTSKPRQWSRESGTLHWIFQ